MDAPISPFVRVASLADLKAKGRILVQGRHVPILLVHDRGRVFALDNRCPHMGFPLERGSVEDGILTCHWHHARFDLASGCTFDLWADDVPVCPVQIRDGEVWIAPSQGHEDPASHWRRRLEDGLSHNLGLVIAKAVEGQLEAGVRQFGEWGDTDQGRHILIAVARYLAAHSPTERAAFQTADIARRLLRGGELHRSAQESSA